MPLSPQLKFLLASNEPALLREVERLLLSGGGQVEVVLSAEAALASMTGAEQPDLALIDVTLPGIGTGQLLAAVSPQPEGSRFPIVLLAGSITDAYLDLLQEGIIHDVILAPGELPCIRLRVEMAMRSHQRMRELDQLRSAVAETAQTDPLTGVHNRATLLSLLFRETDRVQRMNSPLCVILFDIDDFGHWNDRLGMAAGDELLIHVVQRVMRLLRSYDLMGRVGEDEFLVALPGCSSVNAVLLAERIRLEVFSAPFHLGGHAIRLSACFAVAPSHGRSPVVVLREAEHVLRWAKEDGPETIKCASDCPDPQAAPVAFLSSTSEDDLLAW